MPKKSVTSVCIKKKREIISAALQTSAENTKNIKVILRTYESCHHDKIIIFYKNT